MRLSSYIKRFLSALKNILINSDVIINLHRGKNTVIHSRCVLINVHLGDFSYIAANSNFRNTTIGRFCSIGPNVYCGLACHPIDGFSTSPYFYSTYKQCGSTICAENKVEEFKPVVIGNDVFIGANVLILGGIHIGDGSIIAAGSVITKDVPCYAIVGGVPAKIIKYRFNEDVILRLQNLKWWNLPADKYSVIEKSFFDVDKILNELSQ